MKNSSMRTRLFPFFYNMRKKEKIFLVFESRYKGLRELTRNKNYTQEQMGEISWFFSLIQTLQLRGYKVIHCKNESDFKTNYKKHKNKSDLFLIMDYVTIPDLIDYLSKSINKLYCMCYWGRDEAGLEKLSRTSDNNYVKIENVLTPFDYNNKNSYLGYNISVLCDKPNKIEYNNYGILWGKNKEYVDLKLVEYLCRKGIKFYATSLTPINIDGVTNLGVLPKRKWHQLLSDCNFVLGSGNPRSGPTIIESFYYETVLIGPKSQFPENIHNHNIKFIDNLSYDEIYEIVKNLKFEPNSVTEKLCNATCFNNRIDNLFGLDIG